TIYRPSGSVARVTRMNVSIADQSNACVMPCFASVQLIAARDHAELTIPLADVRGGTSRAPVWPRADRQAAATAGSLPRSLPLDGDAQQRFAAGVRYEPSDRGRGWEDRPLLGLPGHADVSPPARADACRSGCQNAAALWYVPNAGL